MKNVLFYLFIVLSFVFVACDKDDDECTPRDLALEIVGEWNITAVGIPLAAVEFKANGDLVDLSGLLLPDTIAGIMVENKTYEIPSNTMIRLIASNSFASVPYDVPVSSYTCDEVVVNVQGDTYTLKRRD